MSICNACTPTKPIARCITNLIIGKIEQVSTNVNVYIINITLGRVVKYLTASSGDGTVSIMISPQQFSEDHSYEVYITMADAIGVNEKQSITINEVSADCVQLRFVTIWESDNTIATFTNQQLSTV